MSAAGLLMTGGSSRRMGRDKAGLDLAGETLAARALASLGPVVTTVLAIGHAAGTNLDTVDDPREGPLVAIVAGADVLEARGHSGALLVLAADMPFVTPALLRHVIGVLGEADAAVPVAGDRDQPLCACYAPSAIRTARRLVGDGRRAMHELIASLGDVIRVPEEEWTGLAPAYALLDVDSPEDLAEARRILDAPA